MDATKLTRASQPAALGGYLKKASATGHSMHGAMGKGKSVRTAEHNGHEIVLTTSYRVELDGKVLKIPLMVNDSGDVHCHSLPNYQFDSAMDMVKAIIDAFPEDFPPPPKEMKTKSARTARKGRLPRRRKS
jgi:hypothetical protein